MRYSNNDLLSTRVAKFFEEGHIKEAIIGEGEYFSYNRDYPEFSDMGYVLSQLITWSNATNKLLQAGNAYEAALCDLIKLKRYGDILRLVWYYFVNINPAFSSMENEKELVINFNVIKQKIWFILGDNELLVGQKQKYPGELTSLKQGIEREFQRRGI